MNSSLEQTIERLAIDADIRDLAARFSDAVNRRDFNAFGDLFADTGANNHGRRSHGQEEREDTGQQLRCTGQMRRSNSPCGTT